MRSALPIVCFACACCSGDGTRRASPTARAQGSAGDAAVATAPADAAAPEQAGALSDSLVQPYWKSADEIEGAARLAAGDWEAAKAAFGKARSAPGDDTRAAHLELVLGICDDHLGNYDDAAQHYGAALAKLPVLADYLEYHQARVLWLAHHAELALPLAQKVDASSIVGPDAEILIGDLMQSTGDRAALEKHYRDYLEHHPNGPFRSEARFHLTEALADRKEQVKLLREIEIDDPLSSWATKAHAQLVALKATPEKLTAAEHIAQGMVLFDAMRNPESEKAFDDALADRKISKADMCIAAYHRAQSRFKARDRKGAAPLFDEAITACKAAKNTDLEIKSEYQAGRSYAYIGEHETAIERYRLAEKIDPKHSYADDAMLREGEEWASLNDGAQVEAVLSALPTTFPDGDNAVEAMWRLGWRAWREQRYDDAIKWWKQQLAVVPATGSYDGVFGDDSRAEATYWLGRAYAAKQQLPDAIAAWQDCARKYPAAYYALQALNRLRENAPPQFQQTVAEISADPAGFDPKAPAFAFKDRPEWHAPGFARAMELVRLGLGEPAGQELRKLGLVAPGDKKATTDPDQLDKLWATAWLDDRANRWAQSVWATRWHLLDYRASWPVGANRARWQIAYPKGYWELLTRHAALNHVPIAMQIAIVREESGFDPLDESYANAVGLTQMIPPTAKDFSKGTGIDPTRENLRDPEKNVTIGSRFLGSLFKDWNDFTLLVPTSYNAGPAAVRRMLKVRGTWDPDEFVEGIVDDQARNYTKRVLGSFFTYTWLYEHVVPEIPNKFPADLAPTK
ncbi:MAG TPA: transglycosylase SLT domain-containing protein [Kofleriaceae bacterium]|nr:transglycosylase SLT domain-containing protein [Kofleriaceae bacterium]